MTAIVIEKNVPIPVGGRKSIYPFGEMEVGDSFFVPSIAAQTVRSAAHTYGLKHRVKFSSYKEGDGVRIWRTA